jgi:GNAT superfamily N-acetyltransferase
VRVPALNPQIWRYAIEDADGGRDALARRARGDIVAFNIAHLSGVEGWMGPARVRPDAQARGLGKEVVRAGVEWLRARGARVIGPRDDAAHDGQHRLLLRARLRARARSRSR